MRKVTLSALAIALAMGLSAVHRAKKKVMTRLLMMLQLSNRINLHQKIIRQTNLHQKIIRQTNLHQKMIQRIK
jgi:hypothetical protein